MLSTLRRALGVTGLVTGLLVVPVVVPAASAQTVPLPPPAAVCGSLGPPICGLLDELERALAPLEPLFALGLPVVSDLGRQVHELQTALEGLTVGSPLDDVQDSVAQLQGVLSLVGTVTKPALAPLDAAGLGGLLSVLTELRTALDAHLAEPRRP